MTIVILADDLLNKASINAQETQAIMEAGRLFGCKVYTIPPNFDDCKTAENALAYVPKFEEKRLGVWVGVIPDLVRYRAIYTSALRKNIQLINSPEQHRTAMEFDRFYPLLEGITPKSVIINSVTDIQLVIDQLDFPVFVKGVVKSNKDEGWNAVVAHNIDELTGLAERILSHQSRSRGKVIVRELVRLNVITTDPNGFPIGREYRVFVYRGKVLAYGFYWDDYNDSKALSSSEKHQIEGLLKTVAKRVKTPFISVDVGQTDNGDWIVIEIGDAQFSGLSQIPVLELWSKVKDFQLKEL